ncbi:NAD(P)/FAD-dependent oxidoreductase [Streptomyces sp. HNM0645]|uniref:phytoene desaturase family protein n=1 Tax=Streptomyces sp. HNM0645 TaxID=2782343 RepID=UPI0024B66104|nr:NAD(P)/FAD-dependent oxidoreductase [Streptomyces sp. HNM0645]MDI9889227.1 NAD(P)/FAD-dependent oxidoreductase [Streptomyces sp. HNM0645]
MTTAVVVGSGPNGLAAALTLAAAGLQVRVIEAADELGGGIRSSELTLPGLVHDECSGMHPLVLCSAFAERFDLAGAGLTWRWAPAEFAHPLDDGRGGVAVRSVSETAAGLGKGGPGWQHTFGPLTERFGTISQEFLQPVLHIPRHPLHLARFGAYAGLPATLLARRFRTPEAQALFTGVAVHSFRPLDTLASSAIGVALTTAAHAFGWPVAEGGSAAIRDAILARAAEHGVQFETGRRVTSLDELGGPDLVMLDTSPAAAARIAGDRMPRHVHRAYLRYRHGPGAFKVDFAVEGGVPWAHEGSRSAGTVHLGGGVKEMAAAERDVAAGRMPARPFVLVGQQYLADKTRSAGDVHPLYAYAHVPAGFTGDATEAITARIEQFAPGFRDRIRATYVRSTTQMSRHNANYVAGDIVTGANDAWQLVFRPRPAPDPYATGVPGVSLCSAATPPGAGAHGMCGYNAAQRALARL